MRCALAAVLLAALVIGPAVAQAPYLAPRAADGHADLGSVWSNAEEDATLEQTIDGQVQSSVFDNGVDQRLPFRDRETAMAWRRKYGIFVFGGPMPEFTLGPDTLPYRDRCLMAANAAAPPMTSQGYNDAYEIVQTPDHVLIAVEMMDEARIVPVYPDAETAKRSHGPAVLARWTGDSVGWWEGDTFVVETVSVNAKQGAQSPFPTSPDARVEERFTRTGDDELLYRAEVTDPATYSRPWSIRYSFHRIRRLWEYACHEGNYGMPNILSGVRKTERDGAKPKPARKPRR